MSFHLPDLLTSTPGGFYGVVGFVAAITIAAQVSQRHKLDAFPAVGSSIWFGSWLAGFTYFKNAQSIIQQGYEKYKSAPFKVPEFCSWTVIVSNREHIEELAKACDAFSIIEDINDKLQAEHLVGHDVVYNPYQNEIIRHHLSRNLEVVCPHIRDEVVVSFAELLDLKENEWKSLPTLKFVDQLICRVVNRVFIGLPLCRDPDWIDLNIRFTIDLMTAGIIIGRLPKFMRTWAGRLVTQVPQCIKRGTMLLGPIIEERQQYLNEYGAEWDEKPNDVLTWLMDEAVGPERTMEHLTTRILCVNVAAVHTSSNAFTLALFRLAVNPQLVQPLRDEIEGIVEKDGWSKVALGKMRKLDSFLKECQRIENINITPVSRKAVKDYTFADGTFIPKGTTIAAPSNPIHHDRKFYSNPDEFEPFRFADMNGEHEYDAKQQWTSTSTEYLAFGLGRHACPGRFFAATELKLMLGHVVVAYDIKLEDGTTYPPSLHLGTFISANPHAKVMFRHRIERVDAV